MYDRRRYCWPKRLWLFITGHQGNRHGSRASIAKVQSFREGGLTCIGVSFEFSFASFFILLFFCLLKEERISRHAPSSPIKFFFITSIYRALFGAVHCLRYGGSRQASHHRLPSTLQTCTLTSDLVSVRT